LFICHEDYAGRELFLELKKGGILVRHFQQPGIENWLRVSIGTDDEMGFFIEKLKTLVV
jgi:histidinol-phosphate aminotransferase